MPKAKKKKQELKSFEEKIQYMFHSVMDIDYISQEIVNPFNFKLIRNIHDHLDVIAKILEALKKTKENK